MAASTEQPLDCANCLMPCFRAIAFNDTDALQKNPYAALNSAQALCAMKHHGSAPEWQQCDAYVRSLVYKRAMSGADYDEIVQQILEAIYASLSKFAGKSLLTTWIYTITLRMLTKDSQHHTSKEMHETEIGAVAQHHTQIGLPERAYLAKEKWKLLDERITQYCKQHHKAPRYARILNMAIHEGRTPEEIAREFGVTPRRVRQIIDEARRIVQQALRDYDAT